MTWNTEMSWEDAQIFLRVAEEGSFSAAALALGVGQATVSRRVAQLEEQLGCALFARGRRGTSLTTQGERLLPAAQQMSRWAAELQAVVAGEERGVGGRVTIACATGTAHDFLVPFAVKLAELRPELRLELRTGVDYLDLTRGEADIALRARASTDPALMTLGEVDVSMRPFASPEYLARCSQPPRAAADVSWICWGKERAHLFPRPQLEALIPGFEPGFASDEFLLQVAACKAGLGVMMWHDMPHRLLAPHALEVVPLEFGPIRGQLFMVCARSMRHVPRVAAVITALLEEFEYMNTQSARGATPSSRASRA